MSELASKSRQKMYMYIRKSHYTYVQKIVIRRVKQTNSFCRRYSQNIFVNSEATVLTNTVNIVEVSTVMAAVSTSVRKLPCEVPRTARQYKITTVVVGPYHTAQHGSTK